MPKSPTPQAISRLLKAAGFDRSEVLSRAEWNHRYTAGFHVRAGNAEVYVSWRPETPLLRPSDAQVERNRAIALEMAGKHAEAIRAAGWPVEVIPMALAGKGFVRVTAKEG